MKQHSVREAWLEDAVRHLEPVFSKAGYAIPPVRVSCGFPASSSPRTTLGQCWPRERSGGGVNEIFISPKLDDPVQLLDTLVHELCHAVDDCFSGHGEDFKGIAQTVGLEGPARMAHATEELTVRLMMISQELGPYPHQAIVFPPPRPSNASRNKAKCGQCGYEVTLLKNGLVMVHPSAQRIMFEWRKPFQRQSKIPVITTVSQLLRVASQPQMKSGALSASV
jgi:hypothetical protein